MNIAFCYENVLPARGGCETYIADLARRLCADRHQVHLYASRWDEKALPKGIVYHALPALSGPRFLRPWRFGRACLKALKKNVHDVTMGFDKTWGQDVLYPQGGLHLASAEHNLRKFRWGSDPAAGQGAQDLRPGRRCRFAGWNGGSISANSRLAGDRQQPHGARSFSPVLSGSSAR